MSSHASPDLPRHGRREQAVTLLQWLALGALVGTACGAALQACQATASTLHGVAGALPSRAEPPFRFPPGPPSPARPRPQSP